MSRNGCKASHEGYVKAGIRQCPYCMASLAHPSDYAACKRCGKPFQPKPTKLRITKMTTCCETCQCKNLFDGLDLPTPPGLLDRHTKHPTLTDAEWRKKLHGDEAS